MKDKAKRVRRNSRLPSDKYSKANPPRTIGVAGLWHLGSVYSAGLAQLGHSVTAFDPDTSVVDKLSKGVPPIVEEGLDALLLKNIREKRLRFTSELIDIASSDIVWITVDTPCDAENRPDISPIQKLVKSLAPHFRSDVSVVVSSQVPVGSGEKLCNIIRRANPRLRFSYTYQPENLQLGRALRSFFEPSRIVVGVDSRQSEKLLKSIFSGIAAPLEFMNIPSAEMVKHAVNAFLATSLSFIYDISDMCEAFGADVLRVSEALKSDARIGKSAYLDSSIGFSGATLGRDLTALIHRAKEKKLTLPVIIGARIKNEKRWKMALSVLKREIGSMSSSTVGFLGVAYKPGTSTIRDSLSLKLMHEFHSKVKEVRAHDYMVRKEDILSSGPYRPCSDPYALAKGSSALLLMTAWPEYRKLDFKKIGRLMKGPKLFFDAKNSLGEEEEKIKKAGLKYVGIGRGANKS